MDLESRPIVIMISGWSIMIFQSERLFGHADDPTSNHQQNKEGKAGITIWISLDADVSIVATSFLVQTSPYYFYFIRDWKPNTRGIKSLNSINRESANRKGGVARKRQKFFITFVSPSSAFRYAFTRRHLWGKTLLLYLSSTFWIYIPVTYLTRPQSRRTGPTSPLFGAYHRASNLLRGLSILDHHGGNAPIDVDDVVKPASKLSILDWWQRDLLLQLSVVRLQLHKLVQWMSRTRHKGVNTLVIVVYSFLSRKHSDDQLRG